jgi:SAM-dependent methyltransferase
MVGSKECTQADDSTGAAIDTSEKNQMVASKNLDSDIYESNIKFWDKAWGGVKTPFTQMPDLPYIQEIPLRLKAAGATTVLDLGCGSGWLSIYLARDGFHVTGVDLATHAVELAQQWAQQENLKATQFQVCDIAAMNFGQSSFDAVVANSIFEHLTYELAERTLNQLKHIIKPGGLFFGCFDKVGTGPGEYYELDDGTHVYTDKGRNGMLLRCFDDSELQALFSHGWQLQSFETIASGSRIVWATTTV